MNKLSLIILLIFSIGCFANEDSKNDNSAPTAGLAPLPHPFMALQTDPPTPEQIKESMRRAIEIQNEQTKARLKTYSEPEMVTSFAKFSRAYYEALIDVGFSKEESLKIVISVGFPNFR